MPYWLPRGVVPKSHEVPVDNRDSNEARLGSGLRGARVASLELAVARATIAVAQVAIIALLALGLLQDIVTAHGDTDAVGALWLVAAQRVAAVPEIMVAVVALLNAFGNAVATSR